MTRKKKLLQCFHCGNLTIHTLVFQDSGNLFFDEIPDWEWKLKKMYEKFNFHSYKCSTCGGINLIGGFDLGLSKIQTGEDERLYPKGPNILPPYHQRGEESQPIPEKLVKIYEEIWFLKHQVPNAFGNQIRRCLEFICQDKKASGDTLHNQLIDLSKKGFLPGFFQDITRIIRIVGNIWSHSMERDLDYWDVELLDEFFKITVDYIYVIPSRLKRLEGRIK